MQEDLDRVVWLVLDEEVDVGLPPDEDPPLVHNDGLEAELLQQRHDVLRQRHLDPALLRHEDVRRALPILHVGLGDRLFSCAYHLAGAIVRCQLGIIFGRILWRH